MTDITQQTARQLVDTIIIAYADKRPREASDAIDALAARDNELEDLKRDSAGLRAWNERLQARVAELEGDKSMADSDSQLADDLGITGRRTIVGKHVATHINHLKKTIAELDAAGMREAADTLIWVAWHEKHWCTNCGSAYGQLADCQNSLRAWQESG